MGQLTVEQIDRRITALWKHWCVADDAKKAILMSKIDDLLDLRGEIAHLTLA